MLILMESISIAVDKNLLGRMDEIARFHSLSRSAFIRFVVTSFLKNGDYENEYKQENKQASNS